MTPAGREECLKRRQDPRLSSNGPQGHDIVRLVQLWPGEELLVTRGFHLRISQAEMPDRFSQKR